ncbi:MAG: hypothetical protein WC343_13595 [Bacilli bacterium]|jgi:uncharacterized membrane protein
MENVAIARINTFGLSPKDNFESQQEQQLITLSISDYRNIFIQIEKLNDRIAALESHISALDAHQSEDMEHLARSIAEDRQRITKLEEPTIQPLQKDRREILKSLLVANGGKILAKDARKKMRVPKSSFSELLKACDFVEKRPYHLDSRQDVLVLK